MKTPSSLPSAARLCLWLVLTCVALALLGGCEKKKEQVLDIRPVRTMVIEKHEMGDPIVLTGQLRARDEVSLAFRLSGKLIERPVNIGDTVNAGQIVARLDSQTEENARNASQAKYAATLAVREQAQAAEKRLRDLLSANAVSRTEYEVALRQLKTATAQVNAARAELNSAEDRLGYTDLRSEADGVITAKGAEPGEVISAGQMILLLARQDGRDAVFDMPAQIIRDGLSAHQEVEVWSADDPNIKTSGQIREISPQADPATRTYRVKVGLRDAPASMFLGSTVVGRVILKESIQIALPSSALGMNQGHPAVWIVDPRDKTVHMREVAIARYVQDSVLIEQGLQSGEQVVTAGVQALHEGMRVRLLGAPR